MSRSKLDLKSLDSSFPEGNTQQEAVVKLQEGSIVVSRVRGNQ